MQARTTHVWLGGVGVQGWLGGGGGVVVSPHWIARRAGPVPALVCSKKLHTAQVKTIQFNFFLKNLNTGKVAKNRNGERG